MTVQRTTRELIGGLGLDPGDLTDEELDAAVAVAFSRYLDRDDAYPTRIEVARELGRRMAAPTCYGCGALIRWGGGTQHLEDCPRVHPSLYERQGTNIDRMVDRIRERRRHERGLERYDFDPDGGDRDDT